MKHFAMALTLVVAGCVGTLPAGDGGVDAGGDALPRCAPGRIEVNNFCDLDPTATFRIAARSTYVAAGERSGDAWSVCIGALCTGTFRRRDNRTFVSTDVIGPLAANALMPLNAVVRNEGTGAMCTMSMPWSTLNMITLNEFAASCMLPTPDGRTVEVSFVLLSP